jgi:hypothetical protein
MTTSEENDRLLRLAVSPVRAPIAPAVAFRFELREVA